MYCGGTLFADHASGMVQVYHQSSLGSWTQYAAKKYMNLRLTTLVLKLNITEGTTEFSSRKGSKKKYQSAGNTYHCPGQVHTGKLVFSKE